MTQTPNHLDGADLVDQTWPYDGPHSPERSAEAAAAISALVRYLNNATSSLDLNGLGLAPQVYRTVCELTDSTDRLVQLLHQLAGWAQTTHTDSTLRHDQHRADADRGAAAAHQAADTAAGALSEAGLQTYHVAESLSRARAELAHLCHDLPDLPPEE